MYTDEITSEAEEAMAGPWGWMAHAECRPSVAEEDEYVLRDARVAFVLNLFLGTHLYHSFNRRGQAI